MATLRERGPFQWEARIRKKGSTTCKTFDSKAEAEAWAKDIADFRREREAEGVSGNTIRLDVALCSKPFNDARSEWGMESLQNTVALAAKPRPAKGRDRRLEDGEEERLLAVASPQFKPVVLIRNRCSTSRKIRSRPP